MPYLVPAIELFVVNSVSEQNENFLDDAEKPSVTGGGNLRVVVVHDSESPIEGRSQLERILKAEFGEHANFDFTWWKISHLSCIPVWTLASQAEGRADLVVFNVADPAKLQRHTSSWLEHSIRTHQPHKPVVVLIQPTAAQHSQTLFQFTDKAREIALKYRIAFTILTPVIPKPSEQIPLPPVSDESETIDPGRAEFTLK